MKRNNALSPRQTGIWKYIVQTLHCLVLVFFSVQANAQLDVKLDFSHERGFYDTTFDLIILSTEPTATIRYTLDGEEPSPTVGEIYTESLPIETTTVLRAIAYVIGEDTSKVYTHSYLYLNDVIEQPANIDGWPNNTYDIGSGNATAVHDYEMDPAIVDSPNYSADLMQGLTDIPSMSIVMPFDDFWDMYDGTSEKKTSIELLYADAPDKNEQEDGGIEPHSHDRLKRSMRLSFKAIYGATNWDSDIFRNAPVGAESAENKFDRIVLRAGNNRAWTRNWNPDRTAYTRDEWYRQSQIASSGIGSHGTFVHLYVNGLYWGLYNPVERPDEAFTSTYLGGEKEDWFAVSHGGDQGGVDDRYDYMIGPLLDKDMSQDNNYEELQEYLDVEKLADYLLISWMTGVQDWPHNNWWGGNRNNPTGPFMYFGWDCEWSWDVTNNSNNGAWVHPAFESNDNGGSASARVFNKSKVNDDFMMSFADRAYKLCFNDGAMTDDNSRDRWSAINDFIGNAIVAESARWGDGIDDGVTRTRDDHWQAEVDRLDGLMDGNVDQLIVAMRDEGYYPNIDPPLFLNNNIAVEVQELAVDGGYTLELDNPNSNGDIYYTTNGVDPRMSGGDINPDAILYSNEDIVFNASTNLLARVKQGNEWSALHCLNLFLNADLSAIKLTEIMYNPGDFGTVSGVELEFLEIKNTSTTETLDISGLQITDGVVFTFPVGTLMEPQSFLVIASNAAELTAKCPDVLVFGEYEGALSNGGEKIDFATFQGDTIIRVEYDDVSPWPIEADGVGYSLVPTETNPVGPQNNAALWTLSLDNVCGSPGEDESCADSDLDSVCDELDICPDFDDTLLGTFCDDGDPNTVNDVYTTNCMCQGIPVENSDLSWLKLTEIMYNPGDFGTVPGGDLEFLEIKNTSTTQTLDISMLQITDGVGFTFPFGTTMAPQSFLVIANNAAALTAKCPDVLVFGEYVGALSNGGEVIEFVSLANDTLITVEYDDVLPWPIEADGGGYSLVPTETNPVGSQNDASLWRLSIDNVCGSPGEDDPDCLDSDDDGICDDQDICPDFDDNLLGTFCDDGDPNTVNDVYTDNCICQGIPAENSDLSWLKLTEIMYNPGDLGSIPSEELEFLEIKNTSTTETIDISMLQITDGVDFTFPFGTTMAPQSFLVIASNAVALTAKCPDILVFGEYVGALSNGGELIEFVSVANDTLIKVEYDDVLPWPIEADGVGHSLVPTVPNPVGSQNDASLWRISEDNVCGSPGEDDPDCLDSDSDGICDDQDICPDFDDNLLGTFCDDGDPNTVNDVYTDNCICQGIPVENSDLSWLKLTEIMYNPGDFGAVPGGDLEFLEIKNTSTTETIDISLLEITSGVDFTFPFGTTMPPQSFLVIASNATALATKCPDIVVFGEYGGALSNGGELIEFVSLANDTLIKVEYDDVLPWPIEADGVGHSLVPTENNPVGSQNDASLWELSADNICGSPGEDDPDCLDSDNDGVCNDLDMCQDLDDNLIGTACDDGDPCTENDVYTTDCDCAGVLADADGDGVCDAFDQCPGEDDSIIGTACDDGNACTINDIYTSACNCEGVEVETSGSSTLTAIDDAYLQGTTRFNVNILRVENGNRLGYLKFDLSAITSPIVDLTLELTTESDAGNGTIEIYKSDDVDWTETTLTTGNAPGQDLLVGTMSGSFTLGTTYSTTLTGITNTGPFSLILVHQPGGNDVAFASDEFATESSRPKLNVTFESEPCESDFEISASSSVLNTNNIESNPIVLSIQQNAGQNSADPLTVYVNKDPKLEITYDPSLTTLNGEAVENAMWTFDNSNPNYYIWTRDSGIDTMTEYKFGYNLSIDPGAQDGTLTSTVHFKMNEAETDLLNNIATIVINYVH